ncbi:MAG: glycosyltransferase family 9 protein [Verrucomicrobiota bacterium]|nr:glycosyltransferase family 9 protein [Verrucomicrobiota bacterium]
MTPDAILKLDRLAGAPACFVLSRIEAMRRLFVRPPGSPPRHILFVKLIEMGSTVLAAPAFQEATRMVGRDNIFFLAFRANRAIVDCLPYFKPENVITIDDTSLATFLSGLWRARRRVRAERIDAAVDMEGLTRSSAVVTYLMGAPRRAGYHNFTSEGPYRGRLFTHELNYNFQHHVSRVFLALVRALRAPPGQTPLLKEAIHDEAIALPAFAPTEQDRRETLALLAERLQGAPSGKIALLNPNCGDLLPLRRWPIENFIELGRALLARKSDVTIIVTGAPAEQKPAEAMAAAIGRPPRAFSLAGRTTLRQALTLYTVSRLLVSNDSGPCHFASLTPVRVIALFGPETPLLYGPLGPNVRALTAGLACSPCVNMLNHRFSPCRDNLCMRRIPVGDVLDLALQALSA